MDIYPPSTMGVETWKVRGVEVGGWVGEGKGTEVWDVGGGGGGECLRGAWRGS
jgi:hypothetical protein